jgi:hypothetical protein
MLGVTAACVLAVSACLLWRVTTQTNRSRLASVTAGTADPVAVPSAWDADPWRPE